MIVLLSLNSCQLIGKHVLPGDGAGPRPDGKWIMTNTTTIVRSTSTMRRYEALRAITVVVGVGLLSTVASAHGGAGHSAAERLPFALATIVGVCGGVGGVLGERWGVVSADHLVDLAVIGGVILAVVGVVGYGLV